MPRESPSPSRRGPDETWPRLSGWRGEQKAPAIRGGRVTGAYGTGPLPKASGHTAQSRSGLQLPPPQRDSSQISGR
jgi:hypothetical protein